MVIIYQLLFEKTSNFNVNVCLIIQEATMYLTFQFIKLGAH